MNIVEAQGEKIKEVAGWLGVPPEWLDALINFETAGTYSTSIKNPYSTARGLIQITDARATDIGYRDSLDAVSANPEFDQQMENVVYPALKPYVPFRTRQEFYMSVFYPDYRHVSPLTEFPEHVRKVNPGITTVSDYMSFVDRRIKTEALRIPKALPVLAALAGTGILLWWAYRAKRSR